MNTKHKHFDSKEESIDTIKGQLGTPVRLSDCMDCSYEISAAGVPLLCINNQVYVDRDDSHTIIFGATGSKKTRNVIMPTVRLLATAQESIIIIDPKAELFDRTANDLLKRGYEIIVVNFRNPSLGNGWNPLTIPYDFYKRGNKDRAYEFVNDIVTNIMIDNISNHDPYWENTAGDLLFGLIITLFDLCCQKKNKHGMVDVNENEAGCFNDSEVNIDTIIRLRNYFFMQEHFFKSDYWKEQCKNNTLIATSMMGTMTAPRSGTQPSILSVFDQKMRFFKLQDNLTKMLSRNDFSFEDIGATEKKHALFIIMPDEKTTYHKLVSLFIKQSYEYFIYKAQQYPEKSFPTRINYLLDEFASLPRISDFPSMISAARSRNIRFNIVIQSQSQLTQKYKEDSETIKANCNNWLFLASREYSLLKELESICGLNEERFPLYSMARLQHLKKEDGEALLLYGRLYPFLTRLYDINMYDHYDDDPSEWEKLEMSNPDKPKKNL